MMMMMMMMMTMTAIHDCLRASLCRGAQVREKFEMVAGRDNEDSD